MNSSATLNAVPKHVDIIMDGNNRCGRRASLPGVAGHRAGVESVRRVLEVCNQRGIEALTLFAFSSENWGRPETEVRALMSLLLRYLRKEVDALHRDNVRLRFIGRRDRFSHRLQRLMERSERVTADNTGAQLVLALDYGGRWDIADTARRLAERVAAGELDAGQIDESCFDRAVSLGDLAPPDLCIRTGGDHRVSNFLLWQLAYAELYFTEVLWPDFGETELDQALSDFCSRERRFGLRGEPETLQRAFRALGA